MRYPFAATEEVFIGILHKARKPKYLDKTLAKPPE